MNNAFKKFDLAVKSAVVRRGGTGLGYYLARGLARSGTKVMIASWREDALHDAAESDGNQFIYHTVDPADRASTSAFATHAISALGGVDRCRYRHSL
jgi:NAD(P)-dependent dehydrogenase (short-subunit alcohol dehydrogenase family)